jgi:capsular polysaccharide biosynthesis protein
MIKILRFFFFNFLYGKIKGTASVKKFRQIKIKKIFFSKNIYYNLYNIPYCRLYTNTVSDAAYIFKKNLLIEPSYQYRFNKKNQISNKNIYENIAIKYGTPKFIKKINGNVFSLLCGGAAKNNYWHWLFDVLPKIGILQKTLIKKKPNQYLCPSLKNKFQHESLRILKIKKNQLINGEIYKHILCKNLITVDHPVNRVNNPSKSILNIPLWIIKWHRKSFIPKKYKRRKEFEKIYIDRHNENIINKRLVVNDNEFKLFLKTNGFKIITLSDYTFQKQVEIFNSAKIIIGLHGAGLGNIIFCKNSAKIIEIQTVNSGRAIWNLAKMCKLKYFRLIEKNLSSNLFYQNFEIKVNFNKLIKYLN